MIHQIYLQGESQIPQNIKQSIHELRLRNPNWEYRFYDETAILNYIKDHYDKSTLDLYLSIDEAYSAAKSDFFRYLVMYQEGGVYLDLKSSCIYTLDSILTEQDEFIICNWENERGQQYEGYGKHKVLAFLKHGEYQQWHIIAKKHSPFLKAVIDEVSFRIQNYLPYKYHIGRKGVLNTTGPIPYSIAIEGLIHTKQHPFRYQRYAKDLGLVYKNADTTEVNRNHYSKQIKPLIHLNKMNYYLYVLWLYLFHTRKVFSKKRG